MKQIKLYYIPLNHDEQFHSYEDIRLLEAIQQNKALPCLMEVDLYF